MPTRTVIRRALTAAAVLTAATAPSAVAAGPPESAFVPSGFTVEKRIRADIGGDARADRVLVLTQRRASRPGAGLQRRLVVLKARSDGGFVLIGEGRRILLCTTCGGAFWGTSRTPVTVKVQRRVVIVEQTRGSRELVFERFRLRPEGALRTRLIGRDVTITDRLTGVETSTSTNLLTGDRIVTRTAPGRGTTTRRSRVAVRVEFLEAVRRR
jgi:hypothetical protein